MSRGMRALALISVGVVVLGGAMCWSGRWAPVHRHGAGVTRGSGSLVQEPAWPAGAATARERIEKSPRHGEWVMIPVGGSDSLRAWVVYPERSSRAPVVLVVHEIFGL